MELKDIFGKPRTGPHAIRIFDIAIVDVLGTFLLAWLFARWAQVDFIVALIIMFIIGSIAHAMVGVRTKFTEAVLENEDL
jgi:fatty acid desaturase